MTMRIEQARHRGLTLRIDLARFLPGAILAGYGIFILSLFVRHVMTWYINPAYVAPTTLAGAVLVGLAVTRLLGGSESACQDGTQRVPGCATDGCADHESSPRLWGYVALALPLLLGLIFPPRGLAAISANQRGPQIVGLSALHVAPVKRVSLSVDTRSFTMMDWVGALSADPNPKDYLGKPVQVTGMVLHSPGSVPRGDIMVLRYLITCCIADARPVGLIVRDTSHGTLKDNQWVTVTGSMAEENDSGQEVAVVAPKSIVLVRPGNPYIY